MKARLLQIASSLAALAVLTGCPDGNEGWTQTTEVHALAKASMVSIESTAEPIVTPSGDGQDSDLSPQTATTWPGIGVYFFPPGMGAVVQSFGDCAKDNEYGCDPPKGAVLKVLEARVVDVVVLEAKGAEVALTQTTRGPGTALQMVVLTNLWPILDCDATCQTSFEVGTSDNGDGTWSISVSAYEAKTTPLLTPTIHAYRPCDNGSACSPGPSDHLSIVSAKVVTSD